MGAWEQPSKISSSEPSGVLGDLEGVTGIVGRQVGNQHQRLSGSLLVVVHRDVLGSDLGHLAPPFGKRAISGARKMLAPCMRLVKGYAPRQTFTCAAVDLLVPHTRRLYRLARVSGHGENDRPLIADKHGAMTAMERNALRPQLGRFQPVKDRCDPSVPLHGNVAASLIFQRKTPRVAHDAWERSASRRRIDG